MSKIFDLINKLCPNGVEYKELGEVSKTFAGGTPSSTNNDYYNGDIPWLRSGEINFNVINKTDKSITKLGLEKSSARWIKEKSVLLAMTGATVARSAVNLIPLTANQSVCAIEPNEKILDYKFLYYCFANDYLNLKSLGQGVLTSLNLAIIKKITIPIPPLEVQEEIVRILDNFTPLVGELEDALKAELEARKKQYEYYREKLIIPKEINGKWFLNGKEIEWKKLGDVGEFIRGNGLQKKDFTESGVGCIHYGQIYTYYNTYAYKTKSFVTEELAKRLKKVNKGDLIITNTSENIEDIGKTVAWLGENEIVTGGHATIFKHNQNSKYLAYYTQTKMFFNEKKKYARGTKVIEISTKDLAKIHIPIPTLSEQQRIVEILDKFDTLVNDLSIGIPAEIEARQKQYEYYRRKLLSFKKLDK